MATTLTMNQLGDLRLAVSIMKDREAEMLQSASNWSDSAQSQVVVNHCTGRIARYETLDQTLKAMQLEVLFESDGGTVEA